MVSKWEAYLTDYEIVHPITARTEGDTVWAIA